MKGILLPRNYIKFPLLKVIVSKIAHENGKPVNTKNQRFLMTDHRNVVRQNYFRDIGDVMLVRNLFRLIRVINRTNSRPIWTPTCEDIDHNAKITSFTLPKKNPQMMMFSINKGKYLGKQKLVWSSYVGLSKSLMPRRPGC